MTTILSSSFERRINKKVRFIILRIVCLATVLSQANSFVFADSTSHKLQDVFSNIAFRGNWELLSKVNFLGYAMQWSISMFCLFGLFLNCIQLVITMMYKSGEPIFRLIHNIKNQGNNNGKFSVLGIGGVAKSIFKDGTAGSTKVTGIDAFIAFLISFFPDIYIYSEYNDDDGELQGNLKKEDSVAAYLMKVSLRKIITISCLSWGWNGTLWLAYQKLIDGVGAVADNFVQLELDDYVDKIFKIGSRWNFTLDASGTSFAELQQEIASTAYKKTLNLLTKANLNTEDLQAIGQKIEDSVRNTFTANALGKALGIELADDSRNNNADNVEFSVSIYKSSNAKNLSTVGSGSTGAQLNHVSGANKSKNDFIAAFNLKDFAGTSQEDSTDTETYVISFHFTRKHLISSVDYWSTPSKQKDTDSTNSKNKDKPTQIPTPNP